MKARTKILIISLSLALTACAVGNKTFETVNFTFKYPENWKIANVAASEQFTDLDAYIYKLNEEGEPQFSFNVTSVELAPDVPLEDFINQSIAAAEQFPGFGESKKSNLEIDNQDTKVHAFVAQDEDGNTHYFMQSFVIKENVGYVLTGLLPPDPSSADKTTIRNIFKSFDLLEAETQEE